MHWLTITVGIWGSMIVFLLIDKVDEIEIGMQPYYTLSSSRLEELSLKLLLTWLMKVPPNKYQLINGSGFICNSLGANPQSDSRRSIWPEERL